MAKSICDRGMRWLIRNGTSINFWHDNWTGRGPLQNHIQGPLNVGESALTVNEVWDSNRNWSLDKIPFVFPRNISDTIHATPKPFQSDLADLATWSLSPNGQFNSNVAYALSKNYSTASLLFQPWKWIWKIPTLPRIQTFIWLVSQEKLLTKILLIMRQIIQDATCPLCHSDAKSAFHILRDYPFVQPLWAYLTNQTLPNGFDCNNAFG
ncbi:putative ribonuclease h protein [Quercus suber]|uniref:Ribonuclease h protein n=1 Tax=Quercus suber TaxID=58331 RepID=A0AAW0K0B0_QUESU